LVETKSSHGAFYNIGDPKEEYSVRELAEAVREAAGVPNHPIEFIERAAYGASYQDPDRRVPSIDKITSAIDWRPKMALHDGLAEMLKYNEAMQQS